MIADGWFSRLYGCRTVVFSACRVAIWNRPQACWVVHAFYSILTTREGYEGVQVRVSCVAVLSRKFELREDFQISMIWLTQ
jgi:hypothetical protein